MLDCSVVAFLKKTFKVGSKLTLVYILDVVRQLPEMSRKMLF